jgi:hypothetical protein
MTHDAMCPHTTHPFPATCETCTLIARVRADQQQRDLIGFGALPDEDAIRADERERAAGRADAVRYTTTWEGELVSESVGELVDRTLAAIREGGA